MNKKELTGKDIFSFGYGATIGAGIFVMMAPVVAMTGRSASLAAIVATVMAMLAFFYNLVIASFFPLKGGDYSQNELMLPPSMMGYYGLQILLNGCTMSAFGMTAVSYASAIFPSLAEYSKLITALIITAAFASSLVGTKFISKLQNIMVFVLLIALALFIIFGLVHVNWGTYFTGNFFENSFSGFISASTNMCFVCLGASSATVAMASVTKKATRTIPKALLMVFLAVAITYALMAVVASGVLSPTEANGVDLTAVAQVIFPHPLFIFFVFGGAVFGILTTLFSGIAQFPYPLAEVAEEGWLPSFMNKRLKNGYPWAMMLFCYIIDMVPLILDISLDAVLSLLMTPAMLIAMYMNLSCLKLPKQYPELWKKSVLHMPMPCYVIAVIASVLSSGMIAYNYIAPLSKKEALIVAISTVGLYLLSLWRLKSGAVSREEMDKKRQAVVAEMMSEEIR